MLSFGWDLLEQEGLTDLDPAQGSLPCPLPKGMLGSQKAGWEFPTHAPVWGEIQGFGVFLGEGNWGILVVEGRKAGKKEGTDPIPIPGGVKVENTPPTFPAS